MKTKLLALCLVSLIGCAHSRMERAQRAFSECSEECSAMGLVCGGVTRQSKRAIFGNRGNSAVVGGGYSCTCVPKAPEPDGADE